MKRPAESEASFQSRILELAALTGWNHFHVYDSRKSNPGWPDLALWRGPWRGRAPRFVLAELKRETGRLSAAQESTIAQLRAAGVEVYVWRPSDWAEVERVLAKSDARAELERLRAAAPERFDVTLYEEPVRRSRGGGGRFLASIGDDFDPTKQRWEP